ncbi:MAG: class I SAM-dependent methyltransferase [Candidatus Omnitrophota bacterium]
MDYQYKCKICGYNDYKSISSNIKDWEYGFDGEFSYYQCASCFSIQIHPFPDINDLIEAYKVDYHGFVSSTQKGAVYSILYKIVEWLAVNKIRKYISVDSKVLDVGCGIGLFLARLKSMGLSHIEGIDFSREAVAAVAAQGINCYSGTFIDFKKDKQYYDVIVMNNYLEHTLNPLEELKKARFLLKDEGVLMCELPNFNSWDRFLFGKYWGGNHVPRHTFQFNRDNLTKLINHAGFTRINIKYPLNTSHFALSIQNFFQRNCKDFKNNKKLKHGRDKYYAVYMLALIPVNILCILARKTGFMKICARL